LPFAISEIDKNAVPIKKAWGSIMQCQVLTTEKRSRCTRFQSRVFPPGSAQVVIKDGSGSVLQAEGCGLTGKSVHLEKDVLRAAADEAREKSNFLREKSKFSAKEIIFQRKKLFFIAKSYFRLLKLNNRPMLENSPKSGHPGQYICAKINITSKTLFRTLKIEVGRA
jgi:hypothetical protein